MCHVCNSEGNDWKYINGANVKEHSGLARTKLQRARLYRVYRGYIANLNLCHIHSIELFLQGEKRFLQKHLKLCVELSSNQSKFAEPAP